MLKYTNKKLCSIIGWDRQTQGDDKATGALLFAPNGQDDYFWTLPKMVAALFFLEQRKAGMTVKLAGQFASRLYEAMLTAPDAGQLSSVELENGNKFIVPTASMDLSGGYASGGSIRCATMIDVRNLRSRLQRLIDADAQTVGDRDE